MKFLNRTLAITGAGLAFVASMALLVAKGFEENPQEIDIGQHLLANKVTDLEYEREILQKEAARWREAAFEADAAAGEVKQENFRISQKFKGVQADAAVASAEAAQLARQLEAAQEEVDRLRRTLLNLRQSQPPTPAEANAPQAAPAPLLETAEEPVVPLAVVPPLLDEGTLPVLSLSEDGAVAALGYGRRDGARKGQTLVLSLGGGHTAKVMLTAVQADFSVALVISGSNDLNKGMGAGKRFPFSPVD